jgi:glycosyltransferase involved in cell wall biosynthesis
MSKMMNRFKLIRMAIKTNPSLIYLRDSFPLRIPRSVIPIILEVQSLVGRELKMRSYAKYIFFNLVKKKYYSRIDGVIYVTNELLMLNEAKVRSGIPKIAIGNAINLSRVTPVALNLSRDLNLFFVGTPNQPWHGVSDIVQFGELNPDINVHIVGGQGTSSSPNLFFYGRLQNSDYYEIASKCIAGVGTLKLTTNQMEEASPLKVREYLAMGLPVIIRYRDVDLDPTSDYVLQLPVDDRSFSDFSSEIRLFIESWKSMRVDRSAVSHLDVRVKESLRLEFFEQVRDLQNAKLQSKGQK